MARILGVIEALLILLSVSTDEISGRDSFWAGLDIEFILLFCDSVHQRKYYIAGLNFFSMYLQYI